MTQPGTAHEAAERNAQAILSGNLAQIMADITPEALAQVMALGAEAGGLAPTTMPNIQRYELLDFGPDGDVHLFHVKFVSDAGTATLAASWKLIMGQWKVVAVSLVSAEPAQQS